MCIICNYFYNYFRSSLHWVLELWGDTRMLCYTEMQGETWNVASFFTPYFRNVCDVFPFVCCVAFQVGNMKKETSALWYKDGHEIKADEHLGFTEGVLKLEIAQVWKGEKKMCVDSCFYVYIYVPYNCRWIHSHIWLYTVVSLYSSVCVCSPKIYGSFTLRWASLTPMFVQKIRFFSKKGTSALTFCKMNQIYHIKDQQINSHYIFGRLHHLFLFLSPSLF